MLPPSNFLQSSPPRPMWQPQLLYSQTQYSYQVVESRKYRCQFSILLRCYSVQGIHPSTMIPGIHGSSIFFLNIEHDAQYALCSEMRLHIYGSDFCEISNITHFDPKNTSATDTPSFLNFHDISRSSRSVSGTGYRLHFLNFRILSDHHQWLRQALDRSEPTWHAPGCAADTTFGQTELVKNSQSNCDCRPTAHRVHVAIY